MIKFFGPTKLYGKVSIFDVRIEDLQLWGEERERDQKRFFLGIFTIMFIIISLAVFI